MKKEGIFSVIYLWDEVLEISINKGLKVEIMLVFFYVVYCLEFDFFSLIWLIVIYFLSFK